MKNYHNPILSGFYPDPSICRVDEDFYLVTSTFEYTPGLPIFHSQNLVDWTLVSHGIDRPSQLELSNRNPNGFGLYAPTIRYINQKFYIACTNVPHLGVGTGTGNFLIWTDDIAGPWSAPIWIDLPGIDPSLFVDDDGEIYYIGTDNGIFVAKIDLATGKTSERIDIWEGTGAADPEGPHLYKRNDYYYLMISEGGTSYGHMIVMARSLLITGPYESFENNPVLTNRSSNQELQAVGHADLVQDTNNNWWAVCLAIRPIGYPRVHLLGRETCLVPVNWEEEWPVFGQAGQLSESITAPLPGPDPVSQTSNYDWLSLFDFKSSCIIETVEGFDLVPSEINLSDSKGMAWIGLRQQHFNFCLTAVLTSFLVNGESGMTAYLNPTHHYEIYLKQREKITLNFRRQIGTLWKVEHSIELKEVPKDITFILKGTIDEYQFSYQLPGEKSIDFGRGETRYLTTEVGGIFTGMMLGLYSTNTLNDGKKVQFNNISYTQAATLYD